MFTNMKTKVIKPSTFYTYNIIVVTKFDVTNVVGPKSFHPFQVGENILDIYKEICSKI